MNKTLALLIGLSIIPIAFGLFTRTSVTESMLGAGTGTIGQLEQWKKSGNYITQNVAGTVLKLTGYESSGDCLVTDANGVVSTSACGTGGGIDGTGTSSQLAFFTDSNTLSSVATGTLTETATGLEFDTTRGLIGGASVLSLTSGYAIPTTTRLINHDLAYSWGNHALAGYDQVTTAGDGLTRTLNDFDCDTASGSVFGCLTSADWTTFNNKQNAIATTALSVNGSLSSSGTLGALVGGTTSQLSLNMANANSWTALQTFANSSTTGVATVNELCFSTGECMNAPAVEGSGLTLYPWDVVTDVATYEGLRTLPQGIPEVDESCSATAGYCASPIDNYISTTTLSADGPLILNSIPAGTWTFDIYTYVNNTAGDSRLQFDIYKRNTVGVETFLFQATTTEINNTSIEINQFTSTQPAFTITPTDRLVMRVSGYTTSGAPITIHWVYNNGAHYSHVSTPITNANEAVAFLPANNVFTGHNTFATYSATAGTTTSASSTNLFSTFGKFGNLVSTGSSTIGDGTGAGGLTIAGTATSTNLKVTALTASRMVVTTADKLFTTTAASSVLLNTLSDETGTGVSVFATNPALAGFRSTASSTIAALTFTIGTTTSATSTNLFATNFTATNGTIASLLSTNATVTNATSTNLAVSGAFNFLGTVITNIATWFSTTLNAVSSFIAAASSTWDFGDAAFLEIPNGTNPTANDVGEIAHDTTDNQLILDDYVIRTKEEIFNFAYPSTSPAFATGTVKYLPLKGDGYTVTDIDCFVEGGTSKAITLFGESITCDADGATDDGTITIPTIAAASTTAGGGVTAGNTVGVVNWLNVTITGVYTRE